MSTRATGYVPTGSTHWLFLAGGALATAATQWAIVWMLARTADPTATGVYGLALAWLAPIFALCSLQLRALLATETSEGDIMNAYQVLRVLGIGVALIAIGVVAHAHPAREKLTSVLLAASISRFAEMIAEFRYGVSMRHSAFTAVSVSQVVRAMLTIVVFSTCWFLTYNLALSLLAMGLAAFTVVYRMDFSNEGGSSEKRLLLPLTHYSHEDCIEVSATRGHDSAFRQVMSTLRRWRFVPGSMISRAKHSGVLRLLGVSLPLALIAFLNHATLSVPRLLLGAQMRFADLATFTCLMSLLAIPSLIATAYASGLSPRFADRFASDGLLGLRTLADQTAVRVFLPASLVTLVLVVGGNLTLTSIFGSQYNVTAMTLVGVGGFTTAWSISAVYGTASTAARQVLPQALGFSLALITCALCGWWWIPLFGLSGAAWSMCIAGVALTATYWTSFRILSDRCFGRRAVFKTAHAHRPLSPQPSSNTPTRPRRQAEPSASEPYKQGVDIHVSQTS